MKNAPIEIFFQTSDLSLIDEALEYFHGQNIEVSEWMLKAGELKSISIIVTTTISLNLASNWIYDKIKNQSNQETVINGSQINAKTVTIEQLNQIFCTPHSNTSNNNSGK